MTKNRTRKLAARRLAAETGISYVEAARVLDDARALRQYAVGHNTGDYQQRLAEKS